MIARRFSENARNWIGASLAAGGPFAVSTKKEIDLTQGIAYGYVPESARAEQVEDFEESLFHPNGPFSLEAGWRAIDLTIEGLRKTEADVLLVDDPERGSDAAAPSAAPERAVVIANSRLQWRTFQQGGTRDIADFVGNLRPGQNAFLLTGLAPFGPNEKISADRVAQLGRSVVAILVGAYDAVSYIVWYRGETIPA